MWHDPFYTKFQNGQNYIMVKNIRTLIASEGMGSETAWEAV